MSEVGTIEAVNLLRQELHLFAQSMRAGFAAIADVPALMAILTERNDDPVFRTNVFAAAQKVVAERNQWRRAEDAYKEAHRQYCVEKNRCESLEYELELAKAATDAALAEVGALKIKQDRAKRRKRTKHG